VLTQVRAQERARLIEVLSYAVDLDFTRGAEVFGSTTVIRFGCRRPGAATFAELRPAGLGRVVLNGRELDPATLDDGVLPLPGLRADNELRVEADMAYSRAGLGVHRFTDPADGEVYLAAHCGVDNAQRVFAAFDQPDLKAPIAVTVTAPPGWSVLGNGAARPGPGGPGRWTLAATPAISSYLFTVVAGPYHSVRAEHRGVPLGLHCRRSLASFLDRDTAEILDITQACLDRYREIFDEPYPFGHYEQAFVPELAAGAMENPGCVTFRDEFLFPSAATAAERRIRGVVIAHEMAHMWFGNLVTMRWWDDLWLSESFAEYMGFAVLSEATGFADPWIEFAVSRKPRGYDADQRASTHPVAPRPGEVPDMAAALSNYDDISYAKGAAAVRQLTDWLGEAAFLAGVNDFLGRHRFGAATLADLLDCLTGASGRDVHAWARHWLRGTGVDTLTPALTADAAVVVGHTRPHRLAVGIYDHVPGEPGRLARRASVAVRVDADARQASVPLPPGPPPALVLVNDGDLSYCKVRFDPASWATVTTSLSALDDPLARAVIWNAARELVRDGELPPPGYLQLAARHLPAETDTAIIAHVLGFARGPVTDQYLDPAQRGPALTLIAGACDELLDRAAADDHDGVALAAIRGLIDCAHDRGHTARLRGWLARDRGPGDRDLSPDLRWQIVLRLVTLGEAGRPQIDREAERDPSMAGRRWATRCRAALPDRAAKQAAWTAMFGDEAGPSSYLLAATAAGFWPPEQAALLAGYVPGYFSAVLAAGSRRDAAAAAVLVQHGFPGHAVDPATLAAATQSLDRDPPEPRLGRLLADQLDDLRRALRVRSARSRPARLPAADRAAGMLGG
jgi:aminopeptidase N